MSEPSDASAPDAKTTVPTTVIAKIRQPHGGALNAGGTKGNKGGATPHRLKAMARKDLVKVLPLLREFAEAKTKKGEAIEGLTASERIRAIEALGRIGMDTTVGLADVRECLKLTSQAIYELLPNDMADMLWSRILPHWLKL